MVKHIDITERMKDALQAVARAEAVYIRGVDSASIIELPKLALADAVLDAIRAQLVAQLPTRARAVSASARPKRRKRA